MSKNNHGKRMVPEYLIAKLETLEPGSDYTAGDGISIEDGVLSVDYGTGITVDDGTLVVDTDVVATKTDLSDYELKSEAFSGDYDDLTNKPTIPAAVSGTNDGTNWTSLTIGSDTYGLASGGGSVDIDNKTIVENGDGELETAAGGWKETITTEQYTFTLPKTSSDWDLVDSTMANFLYNLLQPSTRYDINIVFNGSSGEIQPTYEITEAYIYSDNKTATMFGDTSSPYDEIVVKCSNGQTYNWQFYVRIDTNKIHIWPSQNVPGVSVSQTTSISITIPPTTYSVYHKIKSEYLPDGIITDTRLGNTLKINSDESVDVRLDSGATKYPMKVQVSAATSPTSSNGGIAINLLYNEENFRVATRCNNEIVPTYLKPQIGGGYKGVFYFDTSEITSTSTISNMGYTTQQDFVNFVKRYVINYLRTQNKPGTGYSNKSLGNQDCFFNASGTSYNLTVKWKLTESGGDIVYVAANGNNINVTIDGLTFYYSTGEIIDDIDKVYLGTAMINNVLPATSSCMLFHNPELGEVVSQIDRKFVPLVSDIPAVDTTTAGSYNLEASVDSQGAVTYNWAAGGSGSGKYLHQIQIAFNSSSTALFFYTYYVSNSATAYTSTTDFLIDAGYTITGVSDTMSRYLSASASGTQYAIAYRTGTGAGVYVTSLSINSSGVIAPANWSNQSNTPGIVDVVVAL